LTKLQISLIVVAAVLLLIPLLSGYVTWSLTHPEKKPVEITPKSINVTYQDVEFTSTDGTVLRGWYLPAKSNARVIVLAHGYRGNRVSDKPALPTAKYLVEHGFSVLMFDFRNSGMSDGDLTTVGLNEKSDLLSAIQYVKKEGYGSQGIGLLGFSMGASTSLMTAAESKDVGAVAVDSPFSDLDSYLRENLPYWSHLPSFPFTPVMMWELPMLIGHSPTEVNPLQALDELKDRPVFFIHGTGDKAINVSHSQKLREALGTSDSELWTVEGATHVGTFELDPITYMERVTTFFKNSLGRSV
jgi:dipeptidyl aminopeptidase/acylaminoacyl peptidase